MRMPGATPSLPEALAAVGVLSRIGVSDEALGRAVREWLAKAQGLESAPSTPPLNPGPTTAASPVTGPAQAPSVGISSESSIGVHLSEPVKPEDSGVIPLKVRFDDGSATNITVSGALLARMAARLGSAEAARQRARELAKSAPGGTKNRSAWVATEMAQELSA